MKNPITCLALLFLFVPKVHADFCPKFDSEGQRKRILGRLSPDESRDFLMLPAGEQEARLNQERIRDRSDLPQSRLETEAKLQELDKQIRLHKTDEQYQLCTQDSDCVLVNTEKGTCGEPYVFINKRFEPSLKHLLQQDCVLESHLALFPRTGERKGFEFVSCGYAKPTGAKCGTSYGETKRRCMYSR